MYYYEIAPLQIVRQDKAVFTYVYEGPLSPGQLVLIEVGKKVITGVVMRNVEQPPYDTKPVSTVIEDIPLPLPLLRLAEWMSTYYDTHLALVMQTVLPRGLTKNRRYRKSTIQRPIRQRTNIVFNREQTEALKQIEASTPGTLLLHGITGSGKTAIYIEVVQRMIADGKSAIILVPEISLTPQIVDEFSSRFDNIILTHSRQTEAERHLAWKDALNANEPRVAIGPRSALFLPLKNIGVVIIDESHEPSFKQEQSPRYSALRAASMLTSFQSAKLILGSATPSIEDYYLAQKTKRPIIKMTSTARPSAKPSIELIDMTKRQNFTRHRFMSDKLIASIEQTLASKKQSLVFHNRRGSASTTLCENCGWQATCARCFIPMTLHIDKHQLRCHICGNTDHVPTSCPICNNASIIHKGIGTKLIESELKRLFPKARIARFDGDSENGETLDKFYTELYEGAVDIIVGTQIIAKGLDLPELRTVGVIQADAGLSLPDFGSTERTFQLLSQVVGRVGRNEHETSVIVQSYQPSHSSVVYGLSQNYSAFYERTIAERERAHFPPFAFILKLICVYKTEAAAIRNAQSLARTLRAHTQGIQILGPTPAFYERQRDTYRWQLVLKSNQRALLVDALQHLPASHWQFELDPVSLL